jgi:hypothetical protein
MDVADDRGDLPRKILYRLSALSVRHVRFQEYSRRSSYKHALCITVSNDV